jgi:predicted amidophosphoribosyltransferase
VGVSKDVSEPFLLRDDRKDRVAFSFKIRAKENRNMAEENKTTKVCDNCDATIANDEKVCPACKTDLDELESGIEALKRINTVLKKRADRAAKGAPASTATTTVTVKGKKKSPFSGLVRK